MWKARPAAFSRFFPDCHGDPWRECPVAAFSKASRALS